MTQSEYFGPGAISRVADILDVERPKRVLVVHGKTSYESSGAKRQLEPILAGRSIYFTGFERYVRIEDVVRGVEVFNAEGCDLIVAVGGGTMLDMAKAIKVFSANPGEYTSYLGGKSVLRDPKIPLVAVPTTAGSGSEATHFAVLYIGTTKHSLAHPSFILPEYVVIDPSLTSSLPRRVTAATGLDAFCHSVESLWCIHSTDESKGYAREAIKLVLDNLTAAVNAPDLSARIQMSRAANLAGKAINISKTTACHSFSYPMTAHYGVPHGHAVALTLGQVLKHNSAISESDVQDRRGAPYVQSILSEIVGLLGAKDASQAAANVSEFIEAVGLETRLGTLGIGAEGIETIVREGFNPERVRNNPRRIEEPQLREMLWAIA